MTNLKDIQEELKTQDNKYTCDPIFLVQERDRIYGMDLEYAPESCYYDPENYEELSEEEYDDHRGIAERVGYFDQWITRKFFFTRRAAQEYIENRSYRHSGELRIYVDSLYDNPEMKFIRDFILNYD